MTSIKSLARTMVVVVVLFGQITFITPIAMPGPPTPPTAHGAFESFLNDQQQYQAQQQPPAQSFGVLHYKDRMAQQEDPRLAYLRELIERLQMLEYQQRSLLQSSQAVPGYDYENEVPDFNAYANPAKRSWDKLNGVWGKRAAGGENWNKFRGSWGKREQSWNNLKGLWG